MSVEFRVIGEAELQKELGGLPERIRRNVVTTALRKGGRVIVKEARVRAPRGKTGRLRKSIGTKLIREGKERSLQVGVRRSSGVFYGHLVEFGHGGAKAASPHPFLEPAVQSTKSAVLAAIRTEIEAFLKVLR